jgi:hypothetical protein
MEVSSQSHVSAALLQKKGSDIRWLGIWVGPAAGMEILDEKIQFVHILENETTIPPSSSP